MEQIKVGMIGTSMISDLFAKGALESGHYTIEAVYSRSKEKAADFGKKYGATIFETDLTAFAQRPEIDVVYVASPNSLHFEQAMELLAAKKHVIVEKPAFTSPDEWEQAVKQAHAHGVKLFEAARHIHEENFKIASRQIETLGEVKGARLSFMKYSSRYDQVLAGQEPNIFSLQFAGGALMDLGVYPLYVAASWFGEPVSVEYTAQKIATGVDGNGIGLLRYTDFDVVIQCGKNVTTVAPSEIYGQDYTLVLDGVTTISSVEKVDVRTKETETIIKKDAVMTLKEEATDFAQVLLHPEDPEQIKNYEDWTRLSGIVQRMLYDMRQDADIIFPSDKK
ncbi:Gfo/Idh/MocA family protein [Lacticigenium naphthae]|uniref:Gfo/Idh/MocA family protein n=1 Tax=Lacticigenium naphthae TaxID=515351 RepID=UPI000410801B|nr:Gfo/Idh/MocA family oxidoreductase [Lacticigenium naphthae]